MLHSLEWSKSESTIWLWSFEFYPVSFSERENPKCTECKPILHLFFHDDPWFAISKTSSPPWKDLTVLTWQKISCDGTEALAVIITNKYSAVYIAMLTSMVFRLCWVVLKCVQTTTIYYSCNGTFVSDVCTISANLYSAQVSLSPLSRISVSFLYIFIFILFFLFVLLLNLVTFWRVLSLISHQVFRPTANQTFDYVRFVTGCL